MDFEAWTSTGKDPLRRKRLLVGYFVGVAAVSSVGAFVVLTSNRAAASEEEEPVIEAQLASEPEPEPEPQPEPPAPPADKPKPPPKPKLQAPVAVPEAPLKEAEANKAELAEEGDPFQRDEPAAPEPEPAKPAVIEPPKPPPRPVVKVEKRAPIRLTEDMPQPQPLGVQAKPEFPPEAKARNIEGTVIVKFIITETGAVTNVQVVKGPPELHGTCITAVQSWRFRPVVVDGQPTAVVRMARFPFKIRT